MSGMQRHSRFEQDGDVVVMKFGGTSVEDASAIRRLVSIVQSRMHEQPVVVVSALAGVTDQLLEAGSSAASGHLGVALAQVRDIYVRHESLADSLVEDAAHSDLDRELRDEFCSLESLLHDLEAERKLDLRTKDQLLGFGELFSSRLIKEALRHAGISSAHVDAASCIVTDSRHGQAAPIWDLTNARLQEAVGELLSSGDVPVLGGFIASTSDGIPTTLGRGGSDFTAAIVGAALSAARIEIWTDVDGIMTSDPKLCPEARVIPRMSFEEAADLAHFGAKVLHAATLGPAARENIPVYVLNSRKPEGEGTKITARASTGKTVSAITAKKSVAAVDIQFAHVVDSEHLRCVCDAFDRHSCPVDILGSSLGRMLLLVGSTEALPHIASELRSLADVRWENHKALVCLVGENIRRQPGVASQAFAAVSDMDVRVLCQGASDRTISFLVEEDKLEESIQRLHATFFPATDRGRDWGGISSAFCLAG